MACEPSLHIEMSLRRATRKACRYFATESLGLSATQLVHGSLTGKNLCPTMAYPE